MTAPFIEKFKTKFFTDIKKNLNNLNLRVVLGISNLIHVYKIVFLVSKVFFINKSIYILSHIETNYLKKKS